MINQQINVKTSSLSEFVDITSQVAEVVTKSKVQEGLCCVYVPHTTAAVTINENADPSVAKDILMILNDLIPCRGNYKHTEGNSDAHVKASLIGSDRVIPVQSGQLCLGTWQGIYFCEFDGPRTRKVIITVK